MTKPVFTQADLDAVVKEFLDHSANLLVSKGKEYAMGEDRLSNFNRIGTMVGSSPQETALVFLAKHIDSIMTGVTHDSYDWSWTKENGGEGFKQRIADAINYLFLLAAVLEAKEREKASAAITLPLDPSWTQPNMRITIHGPPAVCASCGRVPDFGSVRWNGSSWEHTLDPHVGHHPMESGSSAVPRSAFQ